MCRGRPKPVPQYLPCLCIDLGGLPNRGLVFRPTYAGIFGQNLSFAIFRLFTFAQNANSA